MQNGQKADIQPLIDMAIKVYEERIPFNRILGIQVKTLELTRALVRIDMRNDLVGNYIQGILHGGVISAVLDATGGMLASVGVLNRMADAPREEMTGRLSRIGTIDLRVDYLRPGRGEYFHAQSHILRAGRKVAVMRMEMHNDQDLLIAVGTGTYIVG
ncbi:MAG: thioesterase family protein [Deltaproteobacteria bacterium]|nr:MAG: thioesterase family protein [Deltaproteobacteria bacterium]RUA01092.1 MAG: thioesterase family protein [Deltaproteobacteria bacterium]